MLNIKGDVQHITNQDRAQTVKSTVLTRNNAAFIFDVDECLVPVNKHKLLPYQHDLLSRLYELTNGAVTFLTNNTGKTVSAMHSKIPCRSEFGMVYRAVGQDPITTLPRGTTPLDIKAITQYIGNRANETRFMPKEASLCFNYYSKLEKRVARVMAQNVMNEFNLHSQNYEISTLIDSIEIIPRGVRKADCIPDIMNQPEFRNRHNIVVGDSGTDKDGMIKTGFGIAVGDTIPDANYILARARDHHHIWTFIQNAVYRFNKNKTVLAPRALIAPT